jgi:hypothetical protein
MEHVGLTSRKLKGATPRNFLETRVKIRVIAHPRYAKRYPMDFRALEHMSKSLMPRCRADNSQPLLEEVEIGTCKGGCRAALY